MHQREQGLVEVVQADRGEMVPAPMRLEHRRLVVMLAVERGGRPTARTAGDRLKRHVAVLQGLLLPGLFRLLHQLPPHAPGEGLEIVGERHRVLDRGGEAVRGVSRSPQAAPRRAPRAGRRGRTAAVRGSGARSS